MKQLTALFVVVTFFVPAFAQDLTYQGTHPRPKPVIVAPASKPVLLHTGKPITPDQKRQLMTTAAGASAPKSFSGTVLAKNLNLSAAPTLITPEKMFTNGVYTSAMQPFLVNEADGLFTFTREFTSPGFPSRLTIYVPVIKNTVYTLVMKVYVGSQQKPQMTIVPGTVGVENSETLNLTPGDNEFAYAFTSNSTGVIAVVISSPNASWAFKSCEITSAAF